VPECLPKPAGQHVSGLIPDRNPSDFVCFSFNRLKLDLELVQISAQVADFEIECLQLGQEQSQSKTPTSLTEFRNFLEESLKLLQNQVKYLELHLRQLQPKILAPESSLEAFRSDLQLPEHAEARIFLGLAKIEKLASFPLIL